MRSPACSGRRGVPARLVELELHVLPLSPPRPRTCIGGDILDKCLGDISVGMDAIDNSTCTTSGSIHAAPRTRVRTGSSSTGTGLSRNRYQYARHRRLRLDLPSLSESESCVCQEHTYLRHGSKITVWRDTSESGRHCTRRKLMSVALPDVDGWRLLSGCHTGKAVRWRGISFVWPR